MIVNIDKIYSRPRIKIPNFRNKLNNKKTRKLYYFIIIWVVVIITISLISKYMGPIFDTICVEEAKKIGTNILNIESSEVLKNVDYNDLIMVEKDDNNSIRMVKSNIIMINLLASDITYNIQEELGKLGKKDISIAIGSLSGSRMLSGLGPNINLKIVPVGNVETEFKSEFVSSGINQTIHRLYLVVDCEIDILTPYKTINANIVNQILFAENIIVGDVPDAYYNLEGLAREDILEVVN